MTVLLNQPGVTGSNPFGYSGSGLNVTLSDEGSSGIQTTTETAGVPFTGTYQAAGSLANLDGSPADGTWTLFFADLSSGAGPGRVEQLVAGNYRSAGAGGNGAVGVWRTGRIVVVPGRVSEKEGSQTGGAEPALTISPNSSSPTAHPSVRSTAWIRTGVGHCLWRICRMARWGRWRTGVCGLTQRPGRWECPTRVRR